jgi:hypothetical protein
VTEPPFVIGQRVRIPSYDEDAVVEQVHWHYKEKKPYFVVRMGRKLKSKHYWPEELIAAS